MGHDISHRLKGEDLQAVMKSRDVVLTTYPLVYWDQDELGPVFWDCVCLDEAQQIKNVYAKQTQAVRGLRSKHRITMTGTPVENRLAELWSIYDFINPGYLGKLSSFREQYITAIEGEKDSERLKQLHLLVNYRD